ncbi:response regulator [Shewanella sp. 125m-7]
MNKARILVVDDDPVCSSLLLSILGDDYQVTTVNSGTDVIDLAKIQHPDIIFLDIMMPGKNGYQVLKDLKEDPQTAKLPVIIVSALSEQSDESLALRIGADGYMAKPITPSSVYEILKKHL